MSTPGRRRALKALASRKRINKRRVQQGKAPLVHNKQGKLVKTSARALGIKKGK